ncbi:MAG: endonuclease/exonuclease/phosphatase family protein [Saprospiraceae bacterium]|nr:endonuclease/exonuclease/phosphatase family protein [Saprospiraceae bacterium]
MKFIKKLFILLNVLLAIASFICYVSPNIDPEINWYFSFFGLSFPILLIFNILFIGLWLFVDIKLTLISLLTLACGWVFIKGFFAFNTEKSSNRKNAFSVVSFNISNAMSAYDSNSALRKEKTKEMEQFIKRFKDEDVICLQETGPFALDLLRKNFPTWNFHTLNKGSIILTKNPLIKKGEIDFGTITNSCLWADIVINFDTLRFYSIHLQSNRISKDADDMIEKGNLKDKKIWLGIKGILRKYRTFHVKRAAQAKLVKSHAETSPYPTILCGDLNDTPISYTYAHLSSGLKDAFYERGTGIGTTYSGKIPFLRIDYIFSSPVVKALTFQVIKEDYSDHYPIAALFELEESSK